MPRPLPQFQATLENELSVPEDHGGLALPLVLHSTGAGHRRGSQSPRRPPLTPLRGLCPHPTAPTL